MPAITEHAQGMPCWIDVSVSTSSQREGLIDFYSALFGWTFDVDAPETGFYSIARHNGKAVLGIGEQSDGQGQWGASFLSTNAGDGCRLDGSGDGPDRGQCTDCGSQLHFPDLKLPMNLMLPGGLITFQKIRRARVSTTKMS